MRNAHKHVAHDDTAWKTGMKKLMVYSHDTFGMGNVSRMLVICRHLLKSIPDLSILLVTGSPIIQSLRLPPGLDYIKLPCLTRTDYEAYSVKYLGTEIGETIQLRSDLILSAAVNYKPDLLLVDKKPTGVKHELVATLDYLKSDQPDTNLRSEERRVGKECRTLR